MNCVIQINSFQKFDIETSLLQSAFSGVKLSMNSEQENFWHLAVIDEFQGLNGQNFEELLKLLQLNYGFKYIILEEFMGWGTDWLIHKVNETISEGKVFTFDEIYEILKGVRKFDWVDFFLFVEFPSHWENNPNDSYPKLVAQCDTFIRGVDLRYMYIYTPRMDIVEKVKLHYSIEPVVTLELDNQTFPF